MKTESIALYQSSYNRNLKFLCLGIYFAFLILAIKILSLSKISLPYSTLPNRGNMYCKYPDILDRNGNMIATTIESKSIYIKLSEIKNIQKVAIVINSVFPSISPEKIIEAKLKKRDFFWIKRHITQEEEKRIMKQYIPEIYFISDKKRIYPYGKLFSHIIGFSDIDGNGLAGLEYYIKKNSVSKPLHTTLDFKIQAVLYSEMKDVIEKHDAKSGFGIILDTKDASVVGSVSLPDFDPESSIESPNIFNSSTLGSYEFGSIMKLFTVAIAIDSKKVDLEQEFDISSPIKVGKFIISDYRQKYKTLSFKKLLTYSSNIGIAQVATQIGNDEQTEYFKKLFTPLQLEVPECGKAKYKKENITFSDLITRGYGYSISVTPIHVVEATNSLVNGGFLQKATLIKGKTYPKTKVFNNDTSLMIRDMMKDVVKNGYGRKANIRGYNIGGKTGTAERIKNGKYDRKKNLASFVAAFPLNQPKYVILVGINEAKSNQKNHGFTTGGMIASPVVQKIVKRISILENIPPTNE